jgi:hypothetical protein
MKTAKERAAQLWCLPEFEKREMDVRFAEAIAAAIEEAVKEEREACVRLAEAEDVDAEPRFDPEFSTVVGGLWPGDDLVDHIDAMSAPRNYTVVSAIDGTVTCRFYDVILHSYSQTYFDCR